MGHLRHLEGPQDRLGSLHPHTVLLNDDAVVRIEHPITGLERDPGPRLWRAGVTAPGDPHAVEHDEEVLPIALNRAVVCLHGTTDHTLMPASMKNGGPFLDPPH